MPSFILMYHNIANPPAKGRLKALYVAPSMFSFQMWYLRFAGFEVVPLHEIVGLVGNDTAHKKKFVALTFDDGYEDFYVNAFPVLEEYGYSATVFIVSDFAGKTNEWDEDALGIRKQLMPWKEIRELSARNIFFGSHTRTHPFLSKISEERAREEICESRKIIEEQTGHLVDAFCYPYGDYNHAVEEMVRKAGYKVAVTIDRGSVNGRDNPFTLRRAFIRRNTHPLIFLQKIHTGYEDRKGSRV